VLAALFFLSACLGHSALVLCVCIKKSDTLCDCDLGKELFVLVRALIVVCVILLLNVLQLKTYAGQRTKLASTGTQSRAVSNIIEALCDCIVDLGPDFRIVKPSPKLEQLFDSGGTQGNAFHGVAFVDFLADEKEKERFCKALSTSSSMMEKSHVTELGQETALMHIRLCSSSGTPFDTTMVHTCFQDESGHTRYIVGIIETAERLHDSRVAEEGVYISCMEEMFKCISKARHLDSHDSIDKRKLNTNSSYFSTATSSRMRDVVIEFEAMAPCQILWASPAAQELMGISEFGDEPFCEFILDKEAFQWWMQDRVNMAMNVPERPWRDLFGTRLGRRDSNGRQIVPDIKIVLEVYFPIPCEEEEEEEDDDDNYEGPDPTKYVVRACMTTCSQINKKLREAGRDSQSSVHLADNFRLRSDEVLRSAGT